MKEDEIIVRYGNTLINDVDSFVQNLSDKELDLAIKSFDNALYKEDKKYTKLLIGDFSTSLLMGVGSSLMLASMFNDGTIKNTLLGLGLATFISTLAGNFKLKSKATKIKKEKIVPIKEVFDKLVKQKEKREFEKEIYPELY